MDFMLATLLTLLAPRPDKGVLPYTDAAVVDLVKKVDTLTAENTTVPVQPEMHNKS